MARNKNKNKKVSDIIHVGDLDFAKTIVKEGALEKYAGVVAHLEDGEEVNFTDVTEKFYSDAKTAPHKIVQMDFQHYSKGKLSCHADSIDRAIDMQKSGNFNGCGKITAEVSETKPAPIEHPKKKQMVPKSCMTEEQKIADMITGGTSRETYVPFIKRRNATLKKTVKYKRVEENLSDLVVTRDDDAKMNNGGDLIIDTLNKNVMSINENNNISNFRNKVLTEIKNVVNSLNIMEKQKQVILIRSTKILGEFITRAESGEITIRSDINIAVLAASIVYAVIVSNEDMPRVRISDLTDLPDYSVSRYYNRYFGDLYPNVQTPIYDFEKIKDLVEFMGEKITGEKGVLLSPKNQKEFDVLNKLYPPSQIPIKVSCGKASHPSFTTTPNRLTQKEIWCRECLKESKISQNQGLIKYILECIRNSRLKGEFDEEIYRFLIKGANLKEILESQGFEDKIDKRYTGNWDFLNKQRRIVFVVAAIFLRCDNYDCLERAVREDLEVNQLQAWRLIKSTVSLLEETFPDLSFENWKTSYYSVPDDVISKFKQVLMKQVNLLKEGKIEKPDSISKIWNEHFRDDMSEATAHRWAQDLLKDDYERYWGEGKPREVKTKIPESVIDEVIDLIQKEIEAYYNSNRMKKRTIMEIWNQFEFKDLISYEYFQQFVREYFKEEYLKIWGKSVSFDMYYIEEFEIKVDYVVSFQPLSLNLRKSVEDEAISLFKHAISVGLGPKDLDIKGSSHLSIVFVFFSLLSLGINKLNGSDVSAILIFQNLPKNARKTLKLSDNVTLVPSQVYPYLPESVRDNIQWKPEIKWDRSEFISQLEKIIEDQYFIGADFILKLFKLTDLSPQEFSYYFYSECYALINSLTDSRIFTSRTLLKLETFIDSYFSGVKLKFRSKALELLEEYKSYKRRIFVDRNLVFEFIYFENRVNKMPNLSLNNALLSYFADLIADRRPKGIFSNEDYTSASSLKLVGDRFRIIGKDDVLRFLKHQLKIIESKKDSHLFELCNICKDVSAKLLRVDHPKILGRILLDYENSFALEVPVWKKINNRYCTGHIDALIFDGNTLVIADYKRNFKEILEGLPQITAYSLLLKERLMNYASDIRNLKFKCVEFCRDIAVEFDPDIIKSEILNFVEFENNKRKDKNLEGLKTQPTRISKKRKDLLSELKKIFD